MPEGDGRPGFRGAGQCRRAGAHRDDDRYQSRASADRRAGKVELDWRLEPHSNLGGPSYPKDPKRQEGGRTVEPRHRGDDGIPQEVRHVEDEPDAPRASRRGPWGGLLTGVVRLR